MELLNSMASQTNNFGGLMLFSLVRHYQYEAKWCKLIWHHLFIPLSIINNKMENNTGLIFKAVFLNRSYQKIQIYQTVYFCSNLWFFLVQFFVILKTNYVLLQVSLKITFYYCKAWNKFSRRCANFFLLEKLKELRNYENNR